jgi:hypothetical protein
MDPSFFSFFFPSQFYFSIEIGMAPPLTMYDDLSILKGKGNDQTA